jgi:RimJ/RimL family protein N-acetyltransferase/anti-anti-sigma regulatory factor
MEEGRSVQLDVDGKLTARTVAAFCQAIEEALRQARAIVVAAESVKDVDAVGLAVLLQASRRASHAGVDFSVVASPALHAALLDGGLLDDVRVAGSEIIAGDDRLRAVPTVRPADDGSVLVATPRMALHLPSWDDLASFDRWATEPLLDQMVGSALLYRCRHLGAYDADFVVQVTADPTSLTAMIVPPGCQKPVGFVRLYQINLVEQFAFLETAVADVRALRRGWGIAASRLMLCYATDVLELRRVEAKVYAYNMLSINALRRNGFVREGRLRDARHYDGRRWDVLVFSILHAEMAAQRTRDDAAPIALWPASRGLP